MIGQTIPKVVGAFAAYYQKYGTGWNSLHIILADGNVKDSDVAFCKQWAIDNDDIDGIRLADALATMSKTQRGKLHRAVLDYLEKNECSPKP